MGIEVDAAGNLVTVRDRNGPAVINVISDPATAKSGPMGRRPWTLRFADFASSINGVAVSPTSGAAYIARSEHLKPVDPPDTIFGECAPPGGRAGHGICHGLIVVGGHGDPSAALDEPRLTAAGRVALAGTVTAPGAVLYRFQLSKDGGPWTDVAPARNLIAAEATPVSVRTTVGRQGAYRARILLDRMTELPSDAERFASQVRNLR